MATHTTKTTEGEETERPTGDGDDSGGNGVGSVAIEQVRNGRLAMLLGGAMVLRGVSSLRSDRRRGIVRTALGGALLAVGLRQRRGRAGAADGRASSTGAGDGRPSAGDAPNAGTVARRASSNEGDVNPRGVEDEPDVESEAPPDEGSVQFSTEHEEGAERKPPLDDTDPEDPRYAEEGEPGTEDHVTVDLSEASMADETSEAVGPDDEQAYPAMEGTDPEPSGEGAPERSGEGAVAHPDVDDADAEPADDDPGDTADEGEMADEDEMTGDGELTDEGGMGDEGETADEAEMADEGDAGEAEEPTDESAADAADASTDDESESGADDETSAESS